MPAVHVSGKSRLTALVGSLVSQDRRQHGSAAGSTIRSRTGCDGRTDASHKSPQGGEFPRTSLKFIARPSAIGVSRRQLPERHETEFVIFCSQICASVYVRHHRACLPLFVSLSGGMVCSRKRFDCAEKTYFVSLTVDCSENRAEFGPML